MHFMNYSLSDYNNVKYVFILHSKVSASTSSSQYRLTHRPQSGRNTLQREDNSYKMSYHDAKDQVVRVSVLIPTYWYILDLILNTILIYKFYTNGWLFYCYGGRWRKSYKHVLSDVVMYVNITPKLIFCQLIEIHY